MSTQRTFGRFGVANETRCCDDLKPKELVEYFWFQLILMPVYFLVGNGLNIVMFLVYHKRKHYSIFNFLHKILAILNIFLLSTVAPLVFIMPFYKELLLTAICKTAAYLAAVIIQTISAVLVMMAVDSYLLVSYAPTQITKAGAVKILLAVFVSFGVISTPNTWMMRRRQVKVYYEKPVPRILGVEMCLASENYYRYPSNVVYSVVAGLTTATMGSVLLAVYILTIARVNKNERENPKPVEEEEEDAHLSLIQSLKKKGIGVQTALIFRMLPEICFFLAMVPFYIVLVRTTSRTEQEIRLSSLFKFLIDGVLLLPVAFAWLFPILHIALAMMSQEDVSVHVKDLTDVMERFPDRQMAMPHRWRAGKTHSKKDKTANALVPRYLFDTNASATRPISTFRPGWGYGVTSYRRLGGARKAIFPGADPLP